MGDCNHVDEIRDAAERISRVGVNTGIVPAIEAGSRGFVLDDGRVLAGIGDHEGVAWELMQAAKIRVTDTRPYITELDATEKKVQRISDGLNQVMRQGCLVRYATRRRFMGSREVDLAVDARSPMTRAQEETIQFLLDEHPQHTLHGSCTVRVRGERLTADYDDLRKLARCTRARGEDARAFIEATKEAMSHG